MQSVTLAPQIEAFCTKIYRSLSFISLFIEQAAFTGFCKKKCLMCLFAYGNIVCIDMEKLSIFRGAKLDYQKAQGLNLWVYFICIFDKYIRLLQRGFQMSCLVLGAKKLFKTSVKTGFLRGIRSPETYCASVKALFGVTNR